MEETTAKFDGMLAEFGARRNAADGRLAEMEAGVVACAVEAETALDDDERRELAIAEELEAGASTPPLLSSTCAVFVTETRNHRTYPTKSAQVNPKTGRV